MSEFKAGDDVVERDGETKDILKVSSISDSLLVCENENIHSSYGLSKCKPCFYIRHATPEEIAAGHRIDKPSDSGELETLDKLENHISPNCKVEDV